MMAQSYEMAMRGIMLFTVGVFFALVLNLLQVQRNITLFNPDVLDSLFSSAWWVAPSCGTAAGKKHFHIQILSRTCTKL